VPNFHTADAAASGHPVTSPATLLTTDQKLDVLNVHANPVGSSSEVTRLKREA
jgi:hypothetical protein